MSPAPAQPLRIEAPPEPLSRPSRSAPGISPPADRDGGCPRLHANFISRPRLVDRLLDDRDASVVLLSAPAGYGKTSTLAEWAERDPRPFAWVTLREEHNDPRRLLASLALAAERLQAADRPDVAGNAVRVVGTAVVPALLEALRASRGGAVLVLDDVQALRSREALEVLARLVGSVPYGAKLALASRTRPVLSLARVRARHELLAWGIRELALTTPEAGALLEAADLELSADQLELVMKRTEGWPAAVYLAALAMLDVSVGGAVPARFASEDEPVAQYVREEVLEEMRTSVMPFLTDTAILDELSPELCDVVHGKTGSGVTLRALAASNLLVAPVDADRRLYRFHPLLREVLLAELSRGAPSRARERHGAAARWFRENGHPQLAFDHALRSADLSHLGRLLWTQAPCTLFHRGDPQLRGRLQELDPDQVAAVPALALLSAHRELFVGDLRRAAHWSQVASAAHRREPQTETVPGFAAGLALIDAALEQDDIGRMATASARGRDLAEEGSPWRTALALLGGVAEHLLGTDSARVRELLSEGTRSSALTFPGLGSHCLSQLALLAGEEGDWETATDLVDRAEAALERAGLCEQPTSALVVAVCAWVRSRAGRIDQAKGHLSRSLQMLAQLEDFIPWYEVETRVLIARTAIRLSDVALARAQLTQASRIARRMPDVTLFRTWFDDAWGEIDGLSVAALGGPSSLTMAELRILRFLPTHLSFREIGGRLHVSTNTVKSQVHAVYRKLDAGSRSEAVDHASNLGLIDVSL